MHDLQKPVVTADEAVAAIADGATIAVGGSGAGHAIPDKLLAALGQRFRATGRPRDVTLVHPFGVGNQKDRGLEHIAFPEMYRAVIGGHWSMAPTMAKLAVQDRFPAYCLPAGIIVQLFHCAAAGSPGWMTQTGLHTFVDPRLEGGKLNAKATGSVVELVERDGSEYLFYPTIPVNVALIHAWTADPQGNLGMNEEAGFWHNCAMAQAAKTSGGITIAVVRKLVGSREILPRDVRVPGCFVDYVVVDPDQGQTYQIDYEPAFVGAAHKPDSEFGDFPMSIRKVIARRAALELVPGAVINIGFGMPDGVMSVAREQGIADKILPTIEHGQFGGVPARGLDLGATYNPDAILETGHMFDFYQGRGVDQTFLGFLEIDREGNVNVSKRAGAVIGPGGFIDIAQKARKLVFCGTLAVRAEVELSSEGIRFIKKGEPKIVEQVTQITFSGSYAREQGQRVLYVTEAAVFRLTANGIQLEEIAPGVDLETDLLPQLGFRPLISPSLRQMPREIFDPAPLPRRLFRDGFP